jgi:hypothetical protein
MFTVHKYRYSNHKGVPLRPSGPMLWARDRAASCTEDRCHGATVDVDKTVLVIVEAG